MLQLIIPPVVILFAGALLVFFLSRAAAVQKKQAHAVVLPSSPVSSPVDVLRRAGGDASQRIKDKLQDTITQPVRRTVERVTHGVASRTSAADQVVTLRKRSMVSEKREDAAHRDEQEVALMRAIEQNPHDSKAYEQLGDYYMEREQFEDARDCYKYVLRLDPRHRRAQVAMKNLDRVL